MCPNVCQWPQFTQKARKKQPSHIWPCMMLHMIWYDIYLLRKHAKGNQSYITVRILSFLSRLKLNQLLHISRFKALIAKSFFFVICSFFQDGVEDGSFFGGSEQLDQEKRQIQTTPAQLYFDFHKYSHHLSCISIFTNTDETSSVVVRFSQIQTPAQLYFDFH